jgi:hypothetical protein
MDKPVLRKVALLAKHGDPGERDAAKFILEKQGTTAEEVLSETEDETEIVDVTFKNSMERELVAQVFFKITNAADFEYYRYGSRRIGAVLPTSKASRFKEDVKTVLGLWRKELKKFRIAFIAANQLWSDRPGVASPLSQKEIAEIMAMAASIKTTALGPLLEGRRC